MRVNQVEHRLRSMRYSHIIHGLISAPVQAEILEKLRNNDQRTTIVNNRPGKE